MIRFEYDTEYMYYKHLFEIKDVNYIVIVYYSTDENLIYSSFKPHWILEYDTSEDKGGNKYTEM